MVNYEEIFAGGDFEAIRKLFAENRPTFDVTQETAAKQLAVDKHDVFDAGLRPSKSMTIDTGRTDSATGQPITESKTIDITRLGVPMQKRIVGMRTAFMLNNPVTISPIVFAKKAKPDENQDYMRMYIEAILQDNKMAYKDKEIARRLMSEMEVAELWYFVENTKNLISDKNPPKYTLKCKILSKELGDTLYPLFDPTGDMVAFGREYKVKVEGKDVERMDVYTPTVSYYYVKGEGGWIIDGEMEGGGKVSNIVGKIMVIYYSQKAPEWNDVQSMIDRFETLISNHGEMNDYFGSPILTVYGRFLGAANKGTAKYMELDENAKAQFLALEGEPESIKMEEENLKEWIYEMSDTPNITAETLSGMGQDVSGVVLEFIFMNAHLAVGAKEEIFGMGYQRRINLLKAAIGSVVDTSLKKVIDTVQFKPVITPYMPKNKKEIIEMLSTGKTSGIISTDSCVDLDPLIDDKDAEKERLKTEKDEEMQAAFQNALPMGSQGGQGQGGSQSQESKQSKTEK